MKRFLRWITRNKWLKLLSVALAMILWVYVTNKSNTPREGMMVNVEVIPPPGITVLKQSVPQVELELYGLTPVINQLNADQLSVRINLTDRKGVSFPKEYEEPSSVPVKIAFSDVVGLPPAVEVRRIVPDTMSVTVDQVISKTLPVSIDRTTGVVGTVKKGMRIDHISCSDQYVTVTGPKSILARRATIRVKPISVENLGDGVPLDKMLELRGTLDLSDPVGGPDCLKATPDVPVAVYVKIVPEGERKILKRVPLTFRGLPDYRYSAYATDMAGESITALTDIEVEGPKDLNVDDSGVRAFVDMTDVTDLKSVGVTREVQFDCPPGIKVITIPKVLVKIQAPAAPPARP